MHHGVRAGVDEGGNGTVVLVDELAVRDGYIGFACQLPRRGLQQTAGEQRRRVS
jgi:hypothetical protein